MVHNAWGRGGSVLERGRSQFSAIRNFPVVSARGKKIPQEKWTHCPRGCSVNLNSLLWQCYWGGSGSELAGPLSILWDPFLFMLLWPPNQQISALRAAQRNMWWGLIKNIFPLPTEPLHCFLVSWHLHSQPFFHRNQPYPCGHCKRFSVDLLTQILGLEHLDVLVSSHLTLLEWPGLAILIHSQNTSWAPTMCQINTVLATRVK